MAPQLPSSYQKLTRVVNISGHCSLNPAFDGRSYLQRVKRTCIIRFECQGLRRAAIRRIVEDFGARIRKLRLEHGWSQRELGRRVGLTNGAISLIESGSRKPRMETVYALADALEVGPGELLGNPNPLAQAGLPDDIAVVEWQVEAIRRIRDTALKQARRLKEELRRVKRSRIIADFEVLLLDAAASLEGLQAQAARKRQEQYEDGKLKNRPHPRVVYALDRLDDALNFDLGGVLDDIKKEYKKLPDEARIIDISDRRDTA